MDKRLCTVQTMVEITCQFPNDATVAVWEWICNVSSLFTLYWACDYLFMRPLCLVMVRCHQILPRPERVTWLNWHADNWYQRSNPEDSTCYNRNKTQHIYEYIVWHIMEQKWWSNACHVWILCSNIMLRVLAFYLMRFNWVICGKLIKN